MGENMRICSKQEETLVETSKSDFLPYVLRSLCILGSALDLTPQIKNI